MPNTLIEVVFSMRAPQYTQKPPYIPSAAREKPSLSLESHSPMGPHGANHEAACGSGRRVRVAVAAVLRLQCG